MITFLDCKQDNGLLSVASACADSPRFAYLVNAGTRQMMNRGDFKDLAVPIHVCVRNGCVVFPRYVGEVRKIKECHGDIPVRNVWYNFIEGRSWRNEWGPRMGRESGLLNSGQTPTYSGVWGEGRLIRAYPSTQQDLGKTLTIFGVDNGNQPLRTQNVDGSWSEGVTITLASPYGSTSAYVRRIDRVRKDVTQGQVFLYGYNAAADQGVAPNLGLEDLAIYDPTETNPVYTRYQLHGHTPGAANCCSGGLKSVVALVKLRFIPVVADSDLVLIGNLDAIKFAMQSIVAGEAGNRADCRGFFADAINELNRELEDSSPDAQFSASNNVFGGRSFTNRCF